MENLPSLGQMKAGFEECALLEHIYRLNLHCRKVMVNMLLEEMVVRRKGQNANCLIVSKFQLQKQIAKV